MDAASLINGFTICVLLFGSIYTIKMKKQSRINMLLSAVVVMSVLSCDQARMCSCVTPDGTVVQTTPLGEVKMGTADELCDELSKSFPGDSVICTVE
ncbi:MAG TPA: hypothetical protein PLD84_07380 [Chitinophagales bacterium]|nr:hypothetical protein [Chitinophagales bacterium]